MTELLTPNPSSPFALVLPALHVSQPEQLQAWLQPNPSSNHAQGAATGFVTALF